MAVPSDPTITEICTIGVQRGGQYNPTSDQLALAQNEFLQEIKADIMRVAPFNRLLAATYSQPTVRGKMKYAIPSDHNQTLMLQLLDGPDPDWRGTAQSGGTSYITLASSFTNSDDAIAGKWMILTGGTGSGQYRQILAYSDTTKVCTMDTVWTTVPDTTTTYLIVQSRYKLFPDNFDEVFDWNNLAEPNISRPRRCAIFNQEWYIYPPPDKSTYGLVQHYFVDMSKIDESSTLFIQLLREWRSLWIQGIKCYTMERYDDERYPSALMTYQNQLKLLAYDSPQYTQATVNR